jgi:hypothetical protein
MATPDPDRFPDLIGKAVIAVGTDDSLVEITRLLATNAMLIAVVAPDRDLVRRCVDTAEAQGAMVNGFTVDPADAAVWARIRPHIEQRLGPIDVAIVAGADRVRAVVVDAVRPDMVARKRGVIIEVGPDAAADRRAPGVRHHVVDAAQPEDTLAALVTQLASDTAAPPTPTA